MRHWDTCIVCINIIEDVEKVVVLHYVKLTNPPFKLDLKKWTNIKHTGSKSTAPNTTRTINCKVWTPPAEYPSRDYKHDIKESEGNMLNPICKGMSRGTKTQRGAQLQNQTYLVSKAYYDLRNHGVNRAALYDILTSLEHKDTYSACHCFMALCFYDMNRDYCNTFLMSWLL